MIWEAWHDIFDATPVLDEFHAPSYVRLPLPLDQGLGNNGSSQKRSSHDGPLILLLSSHPEGVTTADVQRELGLSERVSQKALKSLFDLKRIRREKSGREYRYFIS